MHDYLMMILENEARHAEAPPADRAAAVDAHGAYAERLRASGALLDGERLRPSSEGARVGEAGATAGPFETEGRALGGYYLVRAADLDAAAALAKDCPRGDGDVVDVRPLMKGDVRADKTSAPGKVFAFAVLGSAATEAAWTAVMDRIDAETHDRFPEGTFLGGVRLEAPGTGKRVAAMVVDGPFLESKEVIGGLFFVRFPAMEDAVAWARTTGFVRHGLLEVREVWRG